MKASRLACIVCAAAALVACGSRATTTSAPVAANDPALESQRAQLGGLWVRTDEAGSGNFGAMFAGIKPPELLPAAQEVIAQRKAARAQRDAAQLQRSGNVYRVEARCNPPGIVFMMQHSGAFDIVLQKDQVLVVPEHPGTQVIYVDGRPHPSPEQWTPLGTGHSVGRWDGATLVVSTIGMRDDGVTVPGGGVSRPSTELVQRFELSSPTQLNISYTWTDPALYARPHSYTLTYAKQPADSYAFESWCDVSDPIQAQSVVIPPQT